MPMPLPTISATNEAKKETGATPAGDAKETKAASSINPFASMKVTAKNFVPAALTSTPGASAPDQ